MPNCFKLIKKDSNEAAFLTVIDDEMRVHYYVTNWPDNKYLWNWYNHIGLLLALGWSLARIRENLYKYIRDLSINDVVYEEVLVKITFYLEQRYNPICFYEHK